MTGGGDHGDANVVVGKLGGTEGQMDIFVLNKKRDSGLVIVP